MVAEPNLRLVRICLVSREERSNSIDRYYNLCVFSLLNFGHYTA